MQTAGLTSVPREILKSRHAEGSAMRQADTKIANMAVSVCLHFYEAN
jgi:hypothetical protein